METTKEAKTAGMAEVTKTAEAAETTETVEKKESGKKAAEEQPGTHMYGRFYALLRQLSGLPHSGGTEEMKCDLVERFTLGRTKSLKEMKREEYELMCNTMAGMMVNEMERRKERSRVLCQMQRMGIDTTNWERVNAFCEDARIAGKPFGKLTVTELAKLRAKLHMIERHGGLEKVTKQVGAEALGAMK